MRVLFLSTPFDRRARFDGSRRAIADLSPALAELGIEPHVLVDGGEAPRGARGVPVEGRRSLAAFRSALRADFDLVHAWFAPRRATGLALRAVRARKPVVQTLASIHPDATGVARSIALAGDRIVATSAATGRACRVPAVVPVPFAQDPRPIDRIAAPRDLLLYAGDWEFDDGVERTLKAFAQIAAPRGVVPHLAIAARTKTAASRAIEERVRMQIIGRSDLRGRVHVLGEVPDLRAWIAAARAVVVPASTTFAKLDHPRVLLEALSLGVRIVVGPAPSLAELVTDPRIGEVANDPSSLREAFERVFEEPAPPKSAIVELLSPRRPEAVARAYAGIYEEVRSRRG